MKSSFSLSVLVLLTLFAVSLGIECFYCDGGGECADPFDKDYSKTSKIECTQHCFKDTTTYPASSNKPNMIKRGCSASKCQKKCENSEDSGRTCRKCCRKTGCNAAMPMTHTLSLGALVVLAAIVRLLVSF